MTYTSSMFFDEDAPQYPEFGAYGHLDGYPGDEVVKTCSVKGCTKPMYADGQFGGCADHELQRWIDEMAEIAQEKEPNAYDCLMFGTCMEEIEKLRRVM